MAIHTGAANPATTGEHHIETIGASTEQSNVTEAMREAGAAHIGGGSTFDHEERLEMAEEIYLAMATAAVTEAGEAAYRQGYEDGATDAVAGEISGVNIAEGWDAYSDKFALAMKKEIDHVADTEAMAGQPVAEKEIVGQLGDIEPIEASSVCPICGRDTPHNHSDFEIRRWRQLGAARRQA